MAVGVVRSNRFQIFLVGAEFCQALFERHAIEITAQSLVNKLIKRGPVAG